MRASLRTIIQSSIIATSALIISCESGPEVTYTPNTGDTDVQNGFKPNLPYTTPDPVKGYDDVEIDDNVATALFCDEGERTRIVQEMVVKPIIPDVSVGGINMWSADGGPVKAEDLLGRPEDGKFCEPDEVYLDAYTWGSLQEVIVFFNQETHLVEGLIAYEQYLGSMDASYTNAEGQQIPVRVKPRERLKIGDRELDQYTSSADQADKTGSWLNNQNVTALYKALRETFFDAQPFPANFDCVAEKICNLIYTAGNESTPQDTFIVIDDTGLQIRFSPDGHAYFVYLTPIRVAPFESEGQISFGPEATPAMEFNFTSASRASCSLSLDEELTYGQFRERCIDPNDLRTEARAGYDVHTQRDAVQQSFNGINLEWLRKTSEHPVFKDGEHPIDSDVLYAISFSLSLQAPVAEFKARTLANLYKPRIEDRVHGAVIASNPNVPAGTHPFETFTVDVPLMTDNPQRIGPINTQFGQVSWVPTVVEDIIALYHALTPEQRDMVDPRVIEEFWLLEPFVDAVASQFSHGLSDEPSTYKFFQTTDDRRWSIVDAHFQQNDVPYRLQIQYSLNYGGVTFINIERGYSEVDAIFAELNDSLPGTEPYYSLDLALSPTNPYGLNGSAITVNSFDRQLSTLDVTIQSRSGNMPATIDLVVPGEPIEDRNGYQRQIRGERFEFVPANIVALFGKQTAQRFYVEADGRIGRIDQLNLVGAIELCPGLPIRFGDDVPAKIAAWARTAPANAYTDCNLAFNYSANGNVLFSVASIANRRKVDLANGGAVSASVWR